MKKNISVITLVIGLMVLGAAFVSVMWFNGSPYRVGLDISQAIIDKDAETLQSYVDCNSFHKNFLDNRLSLAECSEVNVFESENDQGSIFDDINSDGLPGDTWEILRSERFSKRGSVYGLVVDAEIKEAEIEYIFVLGEVDGQWRIVDLDLGTLESTIGDLDEALQEEFITGEEVCEEVKDAQGNQISKVCRCIGCDEPVD